MGFSKKNHVSQRDVYYQYASFGHSHEESEYMSHILAGLNNRLSDLEVKIDDILNRVIANEEEIEELGTPSTGVGGMP